MFPETQWSLLARATLTGDGAGRAALEELCARYRAPVLAAVRRQVGDSGQAEDHVQAFFAYLLERSALRRAEQSRGRFRTFLLTVLWRFLRDRRVAEGAMRRGGEVAVESMEDVSEEGLPADALPMAEVLDREWALGMLERALERVGVEVREQRGEAGWQVLRRFLPGSGDVPAVEVVAGGLGLTEAGVRTEVHRLRRRFRESIRRELLVTVSSPEQVDEELAYLGQVLRRVPAGGG